MGLGVAAAGLCALSLGLAGCGRHAAARLPQLVSYGELLRSYRDCAVEKGERWRKAARRLEESQAEAGSSARWTLFFQERTAHLAARACRLRFEARMERYYAERPYARAALKAIATRYEKVKALEPMMREIAALEASWALKPPPAAPSACTPPAAERSGCPPEMAFISQGGGGFCLDRHKVTVSGYLGCVRSGACAPLATSQRASDATDPRLGDWSLHCNARDPAARAEHPVNCVDWNEASAFCAAQGKRLPTAGEWRWAAQGGPRNTSYPWGKAPEDTSRLNMCATECYAWLNLREHERLVRLGERGAHAELLKRPPDRLETRPQGRPENDNDGFLTTSPGSAKPCGASPQGVFDLFGNLTEWTSTRRGGVAVILGHSWASANVKSASSHRVPEARDELLHPYRAADEPYMNERMRWRAAKGAPPTDRWATVGFRCARSLTPARR